MDPSLDTRQDLLRIGVSEEEVELCMDKAEDRPDSFDVRLLFQSEQKNYHHLYHTGKNKCFAPILFSKKILLFFFPLYPIFTFTRALL